jgi:cytochrome P450
MNAESAKLGAPSVFFDPAVLAEPHAFLKTLRDSAPVSLVTDPQGRQIYLVTSYRLIDEVSARADVFSSEMGHLLMGAGGDPEVGEILARNWIEPALLLISDDPNHQRYRALVNAVFAMGRIANMAPTIERIVDDLIDGFIERGEVDFVNEFAVLLPTYVVADILGLPRDKYALVRHWSDALIRIVSRMGTREQQIEAAHDIQVFRRFILDTIQARRRAPADDLMSYLIAVRLDGLTPLTDEEIAPLSFEISVAVNETTRNALMSGIVRFLNNPDQLAAIRADPSLINNAVEELLRFETPATSMWRVARQDTTLDGVAIPAGATLLLRYDSGNRDEAMFASPDSFDILRKNARRHQSFGGAGVHRCLGQMLARKELQIALPRLFDRLQDLHVIEHGSDTAYWPGLLHRGISAVRLGFRPGPRCAVEAP